MNKFWGRSGMAHRNGESKKPSIGSLSMKNRRKEHSLVPHHVSLLVGMDRKIN